MLHIFKRGSSLSWCGAIDGEIRNLEDGDVDCEECLRLCGDHHEQSVRWCNFRRGMVHEKRLRTEHRAQFAKDFPGQPYPEG